MDETTIKHYEKHNVRIRDKKGVTAEDIDCTNCKYLHQVEATGGICNLKEIQVGNDNYCDKFENKW